MPWPVNFNSPQLEPSEQQREDEGGQEGRGALPCRRKGTPHPPPLTRLQHSHQHLSREQVWEETNKVQIRK